MLAIQRCSRDARTQVQDQEESLQRGKRIKYQGSARIRPIGFSDEPEVLDKSIVKNLVSIFEGEGRRDRPGTVGPRPRHFWDLFRSFARQCAD